MTFWPLAGAFNRLNQPENYRKMLSYLVEEPREADDQERKFQFPQMAFLLLDSMPQNALLLKIFSDFPKRNISEKEEEEQKEWGRQREALGWISRHEDLVTKEESESENENKKGKLEYFLSFFKKAKGFQEETQSLLGGYCSRILLRLVELRKPEMLFHFFFKDISIFKVLLSSSEIKPFSDALVSLLQVDLQPLAHSSLIQEASVSFSAVPS